MVSQLKTGEKVVGVKQTVRAIRAGQARHVFLAENADPLVTGPVRTLCEQSGLPVTAVADMKELGRACGIPVAASVAALLK